MKASTLGNLKTKQRHHFPLDVIEMFEQELEHLVHKSIYKNPIRLAFFVWDETDPQHYAGVFYEQHTGEHVITQVYDIDEYPFPVVPSQAA